MNMDKQTQTECQNKETQTEHEEPKKEREDIECCESYESSDDEIKLDYDKMLREMEYANIQLEALWKRSFKLVCQMRSGVKLIHQDFKRLDIVDKLYQPLINMQKIMDDERNLRQVIEKNIIDCYHSSKK